jgi:hypothetical protein
VPCGAFSRQNLPAAGKNTCVVRSKMMEKLPKKAVSLVSWLLEVLLDVS